MLESCRTGIRVEWEMLAHFPVETCGVRTLECKCFALTHAFVGCPVETWVATKFRRHCFGLVIAAGRLLDSQSVAWQMQVTLAAPWATSKWWVQCQMMQANQEKQRAFRHERLPLSSRS